MMVTIEEFQKIELKVGTVLAVEKVENTDRLLTFELDLGSEKRTVVGGWALSYPDPQVLVGTQLVVLVNLEPRTIRGIESQGMLLAATADDQPIALHPEKVVPLGSVVR